jgi:hypothetical protein
LFENVKQRRRCKDVRARCSGQDRTQPEKNVLLQNLGCRDVKTGPAAHTRDVKQDQVLDLAARRIRLVLGEPDAQATKSTAHADAAGVS